MLNPVRRYDDPAMRKRVLASVYQQATTVDQDKMIRAISAGLIVPGDEQIQTLTGPGMMLHVPNMALQIILFHGIGQIWVDKAQDEDSLVAVEVVPYVGEEDSAITDKLLRQAFLVAVSKRLFPDNSVTYDLSC